MDVYRPSSNHVSYAPINATLACVIIAVMRLREKCIKTSPGPNFIELPKHNLLLNNFLLSRNEHDTSHTLYIGHGSLAGDLFSGKQNVVVLSLKFGPSFGYRPLL